MKQIPNLFTLINLILGCIAIVFILQTGQAIVYIEREGYSSWDLPEKITWGSFFIFGAAIVDFLDGFVARLFKAESAMGKQLDSLADAVSFGVAPGLIIFQLLRLSFAKEEGGLDVSFLYLLPAFLIPAAAVWRLAKFNLDESQARTFKGLPAPVAGLAIATLPLIIFYQQFNLQELLLNHWLLYGVIVALGYAMISNWPMISLKFSDFSVGKNFPKYLLIILAVFAVFLLKWVAGPAILLIYVLVSLIFKNKTA